MSKHTPGPWRVGFADGSGDGPEAFYVTAPPQDGPRTAINLRVVVTVLQAEIEDDAVCAANARLVAAAPALLDVVRRIREWDHLDGAWDGGFWKHELDTAIAQAEGR